MTLLDLNSEIEWKTIELTDLKGQRQTAKISQTVLDADCRVSLAMPKTHDLVVTSLSLKNMMGCIKEKDRIRLHGFSDQPWIYSQSTSRVAEQLKRYNPQLVKGTKNLLCRLQLFYNTFSNGISDSRYLFPVGKRPLELVARLSHTLSMNLAKMSKFLRPDISVIDGYTGLEGEGPTNGNSIFLGLMMASADFLAADAVTAKIMGFDPLEIEYFYLMNQAGIGNAELGDIEMVGVTIESVSQRFRPHPDYSGQLLWLSVPSAL